MAVDAYYLLLVAREVVDFVLFLAVVAAVLGYVCVVYVLRFTPRAISVIEITRERLVTIFANTFLPF